MTLRPLIAGIRTYFMALPVPRADYFLIRRAYAFCYAGGTMMISSWRWIAVPSKGLQADAHSPFFLGF